MTHLGASKPSKPIFCHLDLISPSFLQTTGKKFLSILLTKAHIICGPFLLQPRLQPACFEDTSPLWDISQSLFCLCCLRSIRFDFAHHQMHAMLFYTKALWIVFTVHFTWVGPIVCHVLQVRYAMPTGKRDRECCVAFAWQVNGQ